MSAECGGSEFQGDIEAKDVNLGGAITVYKIRGLEVVPWAVRVHEEAKPARQ